MRTKGEEIRVLILLVKKELFSYTKLPAQKREKLHAKDVITSADS